MSQVQFLPPRFFLLEEIVYTQPTHKLVPIPINFNEVEIGATPTTIDVKKFKVGGSLNTYHPAPLAGWGNPDYR